MAETLIVIPCFDEADRLKPDAFADFVGTHPEVDLLLVNDGSRDRTLEVLQALQARAPSRISVLDQQPNRGKAEAVRAGLNAGIQRGARYVGYFDADLAAPLEEVTALIALLEARPDCEMALGSRVALLGRRIERSPLRHYLGRVFATLASMTLRLPVYDTQCGAKLFRASETLERILAEPFATNWIFDVELIARRIRLGDELGLPAARDVIQEQPLRQWIDVAGSKVRPWDFVVAVSEILRVRRLYFARSRQHGAGTNSPRSRPE
jgi:dolichyl-phosphate beta-glucosyltransferase